jgi:hypothetical protein
MIPELETEKMWAWPWRCCTCLSPDLRGLCKWLAGPIEVDLGCDGQHHLTGGALIPFQAEPTYFDNIIRGSCV